MPKLFQTNYEEIQFFNYKSLRHFLVLIFLFLILDSLFFRKKETFVSNHFIDFIDDSFRAYHFQKDHLLHHPQNHKIQ
jgi:hypothetical protein